MRRAAHRKPPPYPFDRVGYGRCRWCGEPTKSNRQNWHPECVEIVKEAKWPDVARQRVYERDGGKCARCGKKHSLYGVVVVPAKNDIGQVKRRTFEVDHIRPLIEANGDWNYWLIGNQQMLCWEPCHKQKTAEDLARLRQASMG